MADSTKVLCPLFDKIETLILGDSPDIFPPVDKMWNFNSAPKQRKMTSSKQFVKLEWMHKRIMSIPLFHLTQVLVLFRSLQNIVILSLIAAVRAAVKSTNVVCPHNRTHDVCILAIFSITGFCGHSTFVLQTIDIFIFFKQLTSRSFTQLSYSNTQSWSM